MLKVYAVTDYVAINGGDWYEVCYGYQVTDKELHDTVPLNFMSFESAYNYLSHNTLNSVYRDTTLFRKKPVICVSYIYPLDSARYTNLRTMAYKTTYKEWSDVSLDWLMKNLSADECIQYLKDRGMTACPILK